MKNLLLVLFFLVSSLVARDPFVIETCPMILPDGRAGFVTIMSDGSRIAQPLPGSACAKCGPYVGVIGLSKDAGIGNGEWLDVVAFSGNPNNGAGGAVPTKGECVLVQDVCRPGSVPCVFDSVVEFTVRDAANNRVRVPLVLVVDHVNPFAEYEGRVVHRMFVSDSCNGLTVHSITLASQTGSVWSASLVVGCDPCVGTHPGQAL